MPRFDPTVERVAYYGRSPRDLVTCPVCRSGLLSDFQSYLLATKDAEGASETFLLGGDYGLFCPNCPTVVLDGDRIVTALRMAMAGAPFSAWLAMGIVDLSSWPADKRSCPLDEVIDDLTIAHFSDRRSLEQPLVHGPLVGLSDEERRKRRSRLKRERQDRARGKRR